MKNATHERAANEQLAKDGMRLASIAAGEPGWYTRVMIDGESVKVWATDLPKVRFIDMRELRESDRLIITHAVESKGVTEVHVETNAICVLFGEEHATRAIAFANSYHELRAFNEESVNDADDTVYVVTIPTR